MPLVAESMTPWLGAAFLVALVTLSFVAGSQRLPGRDQALLLTGLCATITAGALVAIRSARRVGSSAREERERPAGEALEATATPYGTAAYVAGMERWTAAMLELVEHAVACADEGSASETELAAAASDTRDLRELLDAGSGDELSINDLAVIHALCTLWETNQPRVEQLAAAADSEWHRRWAARSVADRRLRHGAAEPTPLVLPYRS